MLQTYMVLKKTYSVILLLFSVQDRTKAAAATAKLLQSCPTLRPHRRQPTRLPHHWDSPGENTGVGCHFLLHSLFFKKAFCRIVKWGGEKGCYCLLFWDMLFQSHHPKYLCKNVKNFSVGNYNLVWDLTSWITLLFNLNSVFNRWI